MMVNPGDPRSPYRQVADALRAEIISGALRPGDPIPSNTTIMDRFKISSSTAQRAVRVLVSEGLVQGVPGRGVFVRTKRPWWPEVSSQYLSVPPEGERDRWTTEGAKQGRRADQRITFVGEVEPPEEVADNLRLSEAGTAVVRKRVMLLTMSPSSWSSRTTRPSWSEAPASWRGTGSLLALAPSCFLHWATRPGARTTRCTPGCRCRMSPERCACHRVRRSCLSSAQCCPTRTDLSQWM
jgi:DNA-binding transcriptional regulator YhcF (GntR family)